MVIEMQEKVDEVKRWWIENEKLILERELDYVDLLAENTSVAMLMFDVGKYIVFDCDGMIYIVEPKNEESKKKIIKKAEMIASAFDYVVFPEKLFFDYLLEYSELNDYVVIDKFVKYIQNVKI